MLTGISAVVLYRVWGLGLSHMVRYHIGFRVLLYGTVLDRV